MTCPTTGLKAFRPTALTLGGAACLAAFFCFPALVVARVDTGAALELVAEGFVAPVDLEELPDGSGRLLVADQAGKIHLLPKNGEGERRTFLDLTDRLVSLRPAFDERGLLGLALHPEFRENRRMFVYYSAPLRDGAPENFDHTARLSEFSVKKDLSAADPASERVLLEVDQPQFNHDGGSLLFGPDGFLYLSLGDGGGGGDVGRGHSPEGNGQDITTLLGSVLRLDVDGEQPYAIPADNPFVGREGRDEIFAYGLRNTWGLSFDPADGGALYGADVGQDFVEEVNILRLGGNYGWRIREGFHCFDPENRTRPPEDCPDSGARGEKLVDPIIEYRNIKGDADHPGAFGVCVIGGHRYRGSALPHLEGRYIFGDWSSQWGMPRGVLLVATPPEDEVESRWEVDHFRIATHPEGELDGFLLAVGQDADEDLYIMTSRKQGPDGETGRLYRLVARGD